MHPRLTLPLRWGAALLLAAAAVGCDSGIPTSLPGETIARERFIDTMIELRAAAALRPTGRIDAASRDSILGEAGVSEEDLRRFVEIHGRNVPQMNELWIEVETRLAERLGVDIPAEAEYFEGTELPPGSLP